MHESELVLGRIVTINSNISQTNKHFSSNYTMAELAGAKTKYKIRKINKTPSGVIKVTLEGYDYVWHPSDLTPVDIKDKESQIFHFDEESLQI